MHASPIPAVGSLWRQARRLADATPAERNRYVDFLRAVSIVVVIAGHWLVAAPYFERGALVPGHMLALAPWTQWLTLAVQVMPVFFLVGGYANAIAWRSTERKRTGASVWLAGRLQRLLAPALPVLFLWIGLGAAALFFGFDADLVRGTTQVALVPTWFLAVYVAVTMAVPYAARAWERFGLRSVFALMALAALVDGIGLTLSLPGLRYTNYAFVWLAIHQLGFAWHAGAVRRPLLWAGFGGAALAALIGFGPYPIAMVGVPGETLSNSSPPSLALLALGVTQVGIVLRLQGFVERWLARPRVWTGTILVNGMIMTVYLWHMTAMIAVVALAVSLGGIGLGVPPGSGTWWMWRPVWLGAFAVALLAAVPVLRRFERPSA
ncbi:MAG: acyltransferase, partial [Myxococcales bacterium]|nr:acyltransferase [Myxococcales bacterium]